MIDLSLSMTNGSREHNLGIELWLDQCKFFDQNLAPGKHYVKHSFDDDEQDHVFRIVLKNKREEHTKISATGEILEDALINIQDVVVDGIGIDHILARHAQYIHDGNGHHALSSHVFYGTMGCNGYVELEFSTPIRLWLLEII